MTGPQPTPTPEPTTADPSSSPPPSGTWKAGQHSRFAGRSAEEILGIAEGLAEVAQRFNQPVPQAPPQPVNRFDLDVQDEDYVRGADVRRLLQQVASAPPPYDPVARAQAAGALYLAVKQAHPKDFARWEGEIRNEAMKLPMEHWNLDTLGQIVRIVRSNHVDELAAEQAQQLVNDSHPTIRSGTGGSNSGIRTQQQSLQADGIPATWKAQAERQGITEAEVREFCQEAGISEAQYYADLQKFGKGSVIRG